MPSNSWAKDKNFHGGGCRKVMARIDCWNEYTWSDRYKRTKCYEYLRNDRMVVHAIL